MAGNEGNYVSTENGPSADSPASIKAVWRSFTALDTRGRARLGPVPDFNPRTSSLTGREKGRKRNSGRVQEDGNGANLGFAWKAVTFSQTVVVRDGIKRE